MKPMISWLKEVIDLIKLISINLFFKKISYEKTRKKIKKMYYL